MRVTDVSAGSVSPGYLSVWWAREGDRRVSWQCVSRLPVCVVGT